MPDWDGSTANIRESTRLATIVDKIIAVHIVPTVAVRQFFGERSVSSLASDR
jgi:hypothetical protein